MSQDVSYCRVHRSRTSLFRKPQEGTPLVVLVSGFTFLLYLLRLETNIAFNSNEILTICTGDFMFHYLQGLAQKSAEESPSGWFRGPLLAHLSSPWETWVIDLIRSDSGSPGVRLKNTSGYMSYRLDSLPAPMSESAPTGLRRVFWLRFGLRFKMSRKQYLQP